MLQDLKEFKEHLLAIKEKAFLREDFEYRRWQMDLALKQQFIDQAYNSGDYSNYNLDGARVAEMNEFGDDFEVDSYSDLYLPLLHKYSRAYLVNMSNLCFPANGDWLNITRGFSQYFYKTGIEKFLSFINDAWISIIKTENQRFSFKSKYKTAMLELINYGNTVVGHDYDPLTTVVTPYVPGIGCAALYPITDDWKKSNLVYYYDVNYGELLRRTDLDQEILSQIKPEEGMQYTGVESSSQSRSYDKRESNVEYGKVRLYNFFLPSVYLEVDGEQVVSTGVFVVAAIRPNFKDNSELKKEEVHILKVTENVSEVDHGLLFAAFGTLMPGTFYHQGPIQPFLPHQYTANQFISEVSRTVGMVMDPPKDINSKGYGVLDPMETDVPAFVSGASYIGLDVKPLVNPTDASNSLNVFLNYLNFLEKQLEEGTGVSKGALGTMHQGRKTATEIKESYSGSQLNLVEGAANYDEHVLRQSIICRIRATQLILEEQVRQSVVEIIQSEPDVQSEEEAYEMVLQTNELFNRLLNYSAIESSYEQFYKKTMGERIQDLNILQEVQQIAGQIQQLIALADAPLMPPPPIPQKEIVDPETGGIMIAPTAVEIAQLQQQFVQQQQMQKDQARMQAKQLETEMKIKQLMYKDVKEPPLPTKKLFFEMLIAPIADSDIVVTGSMTTVSKSLARENMLDMLQAIRMFPEKVITRIDFEGILQLLARANDLSIRDLYKDESDILRETEEAKQEQMRIMQMQQQASQVPGAQIPMPPR